MVVVRVVREPRSALGAQTRAVFLAHRLHRQCEHHRVAQHGFEADETVLDKEPVLVVLGVVARFRDHAAPVVGVRVREHLLEVRFELEAERLQTPYALPLGLCTGGACDEHTFHDRLEPEFELDRGALGHSDHSLETEVAGSGDRAGQALQRARTPPQLVRVEHERVAVVEAGVVSHSCFRFPNSWGRFPAVFPGQR